MSRTLQKKGELRAPNGSAELQHYLDKFIPFEYIIEWLRSREGRAGINNRLLVIQSGTASGKSITIPSEIYINLVRKRESSGGIICTQPRIITATENVQIITSIPAYSQYLKIGETIGWATKPTKLKMRKIGILSATNGTLAMQMQLYDDATISQLYRYIIIDEAHERPLSGDLLLSSLKRFLARNADNPHCPFVILMSATIDTRKFAQYFLGTNHGDLTENIIICTAAPSLPREQIWAPSPVANVITEVVRIVAQIVETQPAPREEWDPTVPEAQVTRGRSDILVFVPGAGETRELTSAFARWQTDHARTVIIDGDRKKTLDLYLMSLSREDVNTRTVGYETLGLSIRELQHRIRGDFAGNLIERRVIISTNVAETGVTIDSLRYVLDMGYSRENEYNPLVRIETLISKPAPHSRIIQRVGRVGRKFAGTVYHLYTRELYEKLAPDQRPDIETANMSTIILPLINDQQKVYGSFHYSQLDLLDAPPIDNLIDALNLANALGFIARDPIAGRTFTLTEIGTMALTISQTITSLEMIRVILAGASWDYRMDELISIAAFSILSSRTEELEGKSAHINIAELYVSAFDNSDAQKKWRALLGDTFFDAIVVARKMDEIMCQSAHHSSETFARLEAWGARIDIPVSNLLKFADARNNIGSIFLELGFDIMRGQSILRAPDAAAMMSAILAYKRSLYDGFRLNIVRYDAAANIYRTAYGPTVKPGFVERYFEPNSHPRTLIFNKFIAQQSHKTGTFEIIADGMSILDGFVGEDTRFNQ
jgi:HrpA-like RNA helicase